MAEPGEQRRECGHLGSAEWVSLVDAIQNAQRDGEVPEKCAALPSRIGRLRVECTHLTAKARQLVVEAPNVTDTGGEERKEGCASGWAYVGHNIERVRS